MEEKSNSGRRKERSKEKVKTSPQKKGKRANDVSEEVRRAARAIRETPDGQIVNRGWRDADQPTATEQQRTPCDDAGHPSPSSQLVWIASRFYTSGTGHWLTRTRGGFADNSIGPMWFA